MFRFNKGAILCLLVLYSLPSKAQVFQSKLPILIISTLGNTIRDDDKVSADIKVIDNNNQQLNVSNSTSYVLQEKIGIEFRGSSSQIFPKKGYSIEARDASGEDKDISIFGWPKEADYVLFASYNEKSFLHNVFTMDMARGLGLYAPRTKYVELILNNEYQGLYVVLEKIKRNKSRVDIAKLDPDEISGDDLTGGYILKIDKFSGSIGKVFESKNLTNKGKKIYYQIDTPKDPVQQQVAYIQQFIDNFENSFKSSIYTSPTLGYRPFINLESFVKYFLVSEISRNMDAYRISSFMHKDKDSNGGKLVMGPVWDYDICYGNADYCQGDRHDLWAYKYNDICPEDGLQVPFWWEKMVQDPYFMDEVKKEYTAQRVAGILTEDHMLSVIDSLTMVIKEAQARNFNKWPILGQYVWPQPQPISQTWTGEVNELKNWLNKRLKWLDSQWLLSTPIAEETINENAGIYPNPVTENTVLELGDHGSEKCEISLYNLKGQLVSQGNVNTILHGKIQLSDVLDFSKIEKKAIYILVIKSKEKVSSMKAFF